MAQILTTALFSLLWTCLFFPFVIIIDEKNRNRAMKYAVFIALYCYHINNVKSFYISMLTSPTFRQNFITAFLKLIPCYTTRPMRNTINNQEEIPLRHLN